MSSPATATVVLAGGHESGDGSGLARFERQPQVRVALGRGRGLHDAVTAALAAGPPVVVVPMTMGRDPTMVAEAAKTLRWLARKQPGAIALSAPFGVADHLTARLRSVAREVAAGCPGCALVIAARSSNPFDDAELHRIAHLVRVHGAGLEVAVATLGPDSSGLDEAIARVRRLGFDHSVVVPAGFQDSFEIARVLPVPLGVTEHAPLMSDAVVRRIVADRVGAALHALGHGEDGIAAGLAADHGHGYAHSHAGVHDHRHLRTSSRDVRATAAGW